MADQEESVPGGVIMTIMIALAGAVLALKIGNAVRNAITEWLLRSRSRKHSVRGPA